MTKGERTRRIIEKTEKFVARNYSPLPAVMSGGEGVWAYDVEGNQYLDMLSGYSALNLGYAHDDLVKAAMRQIRTGGSFFSRAVHPDLLGELFRRLSIFSGMPVGLPKVSGAEAVDTAVKLARRWGYRKKSIGQDEAKIISVHDNFHGRTLGALSMSTCEQYRADFGPFLPGFVSVPFGDAAAVQSCREKDSTIAAVLVEPIQGEGGVNIPPKGYLADLRRICNDTGMLLVLDEIQTGFCRTGKNFAYMHEGISPDVLIIGKAIGGGIVPSSAVLATEEVMDYIGPGDEGSTFGGYPLACAIGIEVINILERKNFSIRARDLGAYFMRHLSALKHHFIKEVRGMGLLIGIELVPEAGGARRLSELLLAHGLIANTAHDHVLRIAPPLIITKPEIDTGLERIEAALKQL